MILSIIVAFDKNRLIGANNMLPWKLPADLKYFKSLTMGHHMIMGRKTFESIGKPLQGRVSVVVTRKKGLEIAGCTVVNSVDEALAFCSGQEEVFIIGGAEIFAHTLPIATRLYITEIDHEFEGDTWFPEISPSVWKQVSREDHAADEKNLWLFSFITYERKQN